MKHVGVFGIVVAMALTLTSSASGSPHRTAPPIVISLAARPTRLPSQGGSVHLAVHAVRAATCTFGGGAKQVTVRCANGVSGGVITILPNPSIQSRIERLWVLARGKGGSSRRFVAVPQAGRPESPPTTTTLPPKAATVCNGACSFTFPQASLSGIVSVAMNSVSQGVTCGDPGLCDATTSQQIDDVNVTVCAGTSGDTDVAGEVVNFSLALADGTQASTDSVSFDTSIPTAFGSYGAVAPNQCVTGDVYFDAPIGVLWSSLNYSYTSANFATQTVYAWKA